MDMLSWLACCSDLLLNFGGLTASGLVNLAPRVAAVDVFRMTPTSTHLLLKHT
jgi:hypothetical protein